MIIRVKESLKKLKIPLYVWITFPNIVKKIIPQKIIHRDNTELLRVLKNKLIENKKGLIIIGANDGFSFDDLMPRLLKFLLNNNMTNSAFFIEPVPFYYNKLIDYLKNINIEDTIAKGYNFALHPLKKSAIIYMVDPSLICQKIVPDWLAGSSSFSYEMLSKHKIPPESIIDVNVKCINFDQLILQIEKDRSANSKSKLYKFNYLQIDTEGFDDQILGMIDFNRYNIEVVKFEKIHYSNYQMSQIRKKMKILYNCLDFGEDEVCFRK